MTTTTVPQAVILYVRQSDARHDAERGGIDYHIKLLKEEAVRRGWGVLRVIVENDVPDGKGGTTRKRSASAFKRRKVTLQDGSYVMRVIRPGFQLALSLMKSGTADGLLAVELDRAMRDPRDLEDLIDVVEARKLNVGSYEESLEFTDGGTDREIDRARDEVNRANRESRTKQKRARRSRQRDAHKAKGHGGARYFGWALDYKTVIEEEKAVVTKACRKVLANISLAAIAAELRDGDVSTSTGAPWSAATIREIVLRERNAGIVIHQGKIDEDRVGEWDRLIDPELFWAVHAKLTDESRKTNPGGSAPRWQGTGVYECGVCRDGTTMQVGFGKPQPYKRKDGTHKPQQPGRRNPRYRCKVSSHLSRNVKDVDAHVNAWVIDQCAHNDFLKRLFVQSTPTVDVAGLRTERDSIGETMRQMAIDVVRGKVKRSDQLAAQEWANTRLDKINAKLDEAVHGNSLLKGLITSADIEATWKSYPLATRQAILRGLAVVTILPVTRKGAGFDPKSVRVEFKHWDAVSEAAA